MKTVDFDIDHIDDFIKYLDNVQKNLTRKTAQLEGTLKGLCEDIYADHILKVNQFTGDLIRDSYVNSSTNGNTVDIEIGNTNPHAYYVENGTGKFVGSKDIWYVHESQFPKGALETYHFYPLDEARGIYVVHGQAPKFFFANTIEDIRTFVPEAIAETFKDI